MLSARPHRRCSFAAPEACRGFTVVEVITVMVVIAVLSALALGVISGAIRDEGTSRHYLPMEFPSVADLDITLALREAAKESGFPWHVGIAQSKDSFYGQHNPERMPIAEDLQRRWKAWMAGGAICSEMEAATLFIVAATLRVRAGGAMLILGNPDQRPMTEAELADSSIDRVIDTSIAGLRKLIAADRAAGRIK